MRKSRKYILRLVCIPAFILVVNSVHAQRKYDDLNLDSIRIAPRSKLISRLVKQGIASIRRNPPDTTVDQAAVMNAKSSLAYQELEGRIIRNISISQLDFEQEVGHKANRIKTYGARLMNVVHADTKEWVIRNNLFIKKGEPLNAYKVADNERFLRTLNFIQDARLVVRAVDGTDDSVDVEVISKDVFSISGGIGIGSTRKADLNASDANFLGMGQSIEVKLLAEQNRWPKIGHGFIYRKNNIGGSFINGALGYMTFDPSMQDGFPEEHSYYISLDRPLVSPYTYLAGGFIFGQQLTRNHYNRPAEQFYKYDNILMDGWAGINVGGRKLLEDMNIRDRRFLSARYMQSKFSIAPVQIGESYNSIFNDMRLALGQLTFFRQDFYKTNYIYGFGVTEDVPYGYNVSLIGGWTRQKDLQRPYAALKANIYTVTDGGNFYNYFAKFGGFLHKKDMQDVSILAGASLFTRLMKLRTVNMRQYISLSYARVFNQVTTDWLRINNPYGLREFNYAFLGGYQRINVQTETSVFINYRLLGFKFAPFLSLNAALLTPEKAMFYKSGIYTGIGGGVRTRNENLVFGTVELRGTWFPRQVAAEPAFKFSLIKNLSYRYNSGYISRPDFIYVNSE